MNRSMIGFLALTVLAAVACTPSPRRSPSTGPQSALPVAVVSLTPAATPIPAATPSTPDWSGLLANGLGSSDPSQADQAVREVVDWAREASGLRAALGPQADELFRLMEQAQATLVEKMLAQRPGSSKPKGMPAPLPPLRWARLRLSAAPSLLALFGYLLVAAPLQLSPSQTGDAGPQVNEYDQAVGDNATAHFKQQTRLTGSKLEMEMETTIRVEKDGTMYEERVKGKLSLNLCPDAQGTVPLDLTLHSGGGSDDNGFEINMTLHAVGHVDDEANLAGWDQEGETELVLRNGRNVFGGVNTEQGQVLMGLSVSGMNAPGGQGMSITPGQSKGSLSYLFAKPEVKEMIEKLAVNLAVSQMSIAFRSAEIKWQDGFCVAIYVPEGESQRVQAGFETPFTAAVRHKFEGKELTAPVIATLKSGAVSVTPSGTKVPARAAFRYKAPDESGQEATVELISRSRRGIGKLDVIFRTEAVSYRVEAPWSDEAVRLTGVICALDKPFTLKLDGTKYNLGPYTGKVEFTPKDATSGSWMWTSTYAVGQLEGSDRGGSTYQVAGLKEGKPVLMMSDFTQVGALAGHGYSFRWPGWPIELNPETGSCSSE